MNKTILITLTLIGYCLGIAVSSAEASTATIKLANIDSCEISGFQFFFYALDSTYQWPAEVDFHGVWGTAADESSWWLDTLINAESLVRGVTAYDLNFSTANKLVNGTVATLSSTTHFGINPGHSGNDIWDYGGPYGKSIIDQLQVSESWVGSDQVVTISGVFVPIPATAFLLGSGVLSLFGMRRLRSSRE